MRLTRNTRPSHARGTRHFGVMCVCVCVRARGGANTRQGATPPGLLLSAPQVRSREKAPLSPAGAEPTSSCPTQAPPLPELLPAAGATIRLQVSTWSTLYQSKLYCTPKALNPKPYTKLRYVCCCYRCCCLPALGRFQVQGASSMHQPYTACVSDASALYIEHASASCSRVMRAPARASQTERQEGRERRRVAFCPQTAPRPLAGGATTVPRGSAATESEKTGM
jgi:hypothetical protein